MCLGKPIPSYRANAKMVPQRTHQTYFYARWILSKTENYLYALFLWLNVAFPVGLVAWHFSYFQNKKYIAIGCLPSIISLLLIIFLTKNGLGSSYMIFHRLLFRLVEDIFQSEQIQLISLGVNVILGCWSGYGSGFCT